MKLRKGDRFKDYVYYGVIIEVTGNIKRLNHYWTADVVVIGPNDHFAAGETATDYGISDRDEYLGNFANDTSFNELYDILNAE